MAAVVVHGEDLTDPEDPDDETDDGYTQNDDDQGTPKMFDHGPGGFPKTLPPIFDNPFVARHRLRLKGTRLGAPAHPVLSSWYCRDPPADASSRPRSLSDTFDLDTGASLQPRAVGGSAA